MGDYLAFGNATASVAESQALWQPGSERTLNSAFCRPRIRLGLPHSSLSNRGICFRCTLNS